MVVYSDISPRTQAYADKRLLKRIEKNNILGQFGQTRELPQGSTKTINFRRYNKLAAATTPLAEGVTPTGKSMTKTDISVSIQQYGDWVGITDVIRDTHEDPVLQENIDILGEQADETWDVLRAGTLKAGTNVLYANGTSRTDVNTAISKTLLRKAERILGRQEAKPITGVMKAGPNIGTYPIPPAFIAVCHIDTKMDWEALSDWVPVQSYPGSVGTINGEIGSSGMFRVVIDNNLSAWADAGATKGSMISTTGSNADVYPILIFGKDAYATVSMSGKNAVQTYVANPKASESDPLAQRGTVGWKGYMATVILQDLWMLRLEVACTNG